MVDAPVGAAVKLLLARDMPVIAQPGRSAAQRFTYAYRPLPILGLRRLPW